MSNKPVFKLCNITPVGFRIPDYKIEICSICRGALLSVCNDCENKNIKDCDVKTNEKGDIYHAHCSRLLDKYV